MITPAERIARSAGVSAARRICFHARRARTASRWATAWMPWASMVSKRVTASAACACARVVRAPSPAPLCERDAPPPLQLIHRWVEEVYEAHVCSTVLMCLPTSHRAFSALSVLFCQGRCSSAFLRRTFAHMALSLCVLCASAATSPRTLCAFAVRRRNAHRTPRRRRAPC